MNAAHDDHHDLPPRDDGTTLDVVGIGNALVDVLSHENEDFIAGADLVKGAMTLVETDRATELYGAMGPGIEVSGGSAANTVAGVASFGGRAGYLGKVFDDQLGMVFAHDMRANGVVFQSPAAADGPPTGRCLIVVTPDAERTMNTYLGASSMFGPDDVDEDLVAAGRITYLEGYLFDRDEAKAAYRRASDIAHAADRRVALTLSDTFCVERHLDEWRLLVTESVDVLFANEAEIQVLYGVQLHEAVERARSEVEITCVTLGPRGSLLVTADEIVEVPAEPVEKVVDTTGAGDLYASGVLYGLSQGLPLAECGRLGSIAASAVIGHTGARPGQSLAQLT
ncbi:adenosine kinase [Actinospongicola halichondriae]|uniref:adenosine kinase n=1 Tax=Actinospongicola halichondriae TaxID=3236844 RepID=UPI003D396689